MIAQSPLLPNPVVGVVAAGVVALGAVPMLVAAWWCRLLRGASVLHGLIVLSVIAVTDVVHFNVRVASWLTGDLAVVHPATVLPSLTVLVALGWMWGRTSVNRLLAEPRE